MRSRHLELLKSLSEKNREKEEQQKKEERRLHKRETILKSRILQRDTLQRSSSTDARSVITVATGAVAAVVQGATEDTANGVVTNDEDDVQYKKRCNLDIQKRQEEAIRRLSNLQETERVKQEREKLKREWRAHKAQKSWLSNCKDSELREYLESKGKPRALPKLPAQFAGALAIKGIGTEHAMEVVDEEVTVMASQAEDDRKVHASAMSQDSVEEARGARHCPSPSKVTLISVNQSCLRFLERTRSTRAAAHCSDLAEWRRRNGAAPDQPVFVCIGGYPDFRDALLKRGWFQNIDKESRHFDIKWGMVGDIDHERLRPNQIVNHFAKCRDLTTKVGLSLNLRNCSWFSGVDSDEFYPRAFDLYDPLERADFVLNFKFTKAESILRQFLEHIELGVDMTFSQDLIRLTNKICLRQLTDVDDVLDCPEFAETLANVTASEWDVLKEVCLEDVSRKLEVPKDKELDEMISRTAQSDVQKRAHARDKEKEEKEKAEQRKNSKGCKAKKKKKKKSEDDEEEEEIPINAPTASFDSNLGKHLISQTRTILEELEQKNAQHCIHGARNAWIIKPAGKSRGRGIQVMRELDEMFKATESDGYQWICQKYIEQPQLVHGYKFDIRQWVLVEDWNPLKVYIWQQPYLRFAGQKYDNSLSSLSEYMHLVNNSIIKYMDGFQEKNDDLDASGYMWFRQQYEGWLHGTHCKCKRHSTPWLTPPPYTCDTFGVKWEDVKFTAKDEDDEDDGDRDQVPATTEIRANPSSSHPPSDALAQDVEQPTENEEPRPESPTESEETSCQEPSHESPKADANTPSRASEKNQKEAEVDQQSDNDDDDPDHVCENLWETCIKPQINDIVTMSLLCVVDSITHRKNSYELYGYDFMLSPGSDGRPKVWLIEVNSSPACDYSTPVTTPLVKKMMEDTAKIMVDKRTDPDCDTGEWELLKHNYNKQVPNPRTFANSEKLEVHGTKMKLPAKKKKKKKQKGSEACNAANADEGEDGEDDDCDEDE
mmetsp:Transcript_65063/g.103088  ORF Transcript_65063/g.103088 Transcript_65063/m.103088 type:complete len:1000 (-) Transcript_65063:144-3143(-)